MRSHLCLTVRFLQPYFHGRADRDAPEWPPSPLRCFQAIVAAATTRWRGDEFRAQCEPALRWLECQAVPRVVAAVAVTAPSKYRLYVPDNVADKVAKSWLAGREATIADYRSEKDVQPMALRDGEAVHYLYALGDDGCPNFDAMVSMMRSVTHLGWGIDMVAGDASIVSDDAMRELPGETWSPTSAASEIKLRTVARGTLDDLVARHAAFLGRLDQESFRPVPPLSAYQAIGYRRESEPAPRRWAAFSVQQPDRAGMKSFDPLGATRRLVGMTRRATYAAARLSGWGEGRLASSVLGHGERRNEPAHIPVTSQRFAFLPLPSIEPRGVGKAKVVGSARRIIITCFGEACDDDISWAKESLAGAELVDEDTGLTQAVLSTTLRQDRVLPAYVDAAAKWSTVTPVVLPGYDDPNHIRRKLKRAKSAEEQRPLLAALDKRIDGLLRKAILQAGFSPELAANADLQWSQVGFRPGLGLASRYAVPDYLHRFPRWHVRVTWRNANGGIAKVRGPICFGGGRYCGLGLFATED